MSESGLETPNKVWGLLVFQKPSDADREDADHKTITDSIIRHRIKCFIAVFFQVWPPDMPPGNSLRMQIVWLSPQAYCLKIAGMNPAICVLTAFQVILMCANFENPCFTYILSFNPHNPVK